MYEINHHFLTDALETTRATPAFPQYADVLKRMESFKTWPEYLPLKPDCLVEAGLVYTGVNDNVKCYHCGGGLRNWESGDQPWVEHAKLYPACPHVLLVKGQCYVNAITRGENPDEDQERLTRQTPKFPEYTEVSKRMESFETWPENQPLQPGCLAQAGFVYTGMSDSVRCYHCGVVLGNWGSGDNPWTEHAIWNPNCPHVLFLKGHIHADVLTPAKQTDTDREMKPKFPQYAIASKRMDSFKTWPGNIPLQADCLVEAGFVYTGVNDSVRCYHCGVVLGNWKCGDDPWMEHDRWYPDCPNVLLVKCHIHADVLTRGEIPNANRKMKPTFPQYAVISKRMESFRTWPEHLPLQPDDLVEAGFVYTGIADIVRCYHCGGVIRNWTSGDNPWTKHVKLYPNCPYVPLVKRCVAVPPPCKTPIKDMEMVIRDSINTAVAQNCVQNGFSEEFVRKAIEMFIQTYGHRNFEGNDLYVILRNIDNSIDMTQSLYGVTGARASGPNEDVNAQLPDRCMICLDGVADVVCLPCGHLVCCPQCVLRLSNCPICENTAKDYVKPYDCD